MRRTARTVSVPPAMADVRPIYATHYDLGVAGSLQDVAAPPYDVIDAILDHYFVHCRSTAEILQQGFDPATVRRVVRLIDLNEY